MCLAIIFSNASLSGGQPTGTTALAVALRISEVASPRRKICTSWPASASASPCKKGNAALVGWSEPQALFIMILRVFFFGSSGLAPKERKGKPTSCAKNCRRTIVSSYYEISRDGRRKAYSLFLLGV